MSRAPTARALSKRIGAVSISAWASATPPGCSPSIDRRLFPGDPLDHAEGLQMRGRHGGHHRHVRPGHARERRDLTGGVHADLDDRESVSMGIRASVTGTPQWLLKLASAAWVRPCPAARRAASP
jgi:hypothetical protein